MLYAQIDVVCASIKALGHTDVRVRISETGWPSKGDVDEPEATVENVEIYNRTCCKGGQGTPAHPSQRIDIYVFALFNENMKPGPTFERIRGTMDCIILMVVMFITLVFKDIFLTILLYVKMNSISFGFLFCYLARYSLLKQMKCFTNFTLKNKKRSKG